MKFAFLTLVLLTGQSASATLNPASPRGKSVERFDIPGRLCAEGIEYGLKDLHREKRLCRLDAWINTLPI